MIRTLFVVLITHVFANPALNLCVDISGFYNIGERNGDFTGSQAVLLQNVCDISFTTESDSDSNDSDESYNGLVMGNSIHMDENVGTIADDGLISWDNGYYFYPEGMAERHFELDCMSNASLECLEECEHCVPCGLENDPRAEGMDCGKECGHCEKCLDFMPCMTKLESYGPIGAACTGHEPVQCLDTCFDCKDCSAHLWCLDAITDENCYSDGALECLERLDQCQDCAENPGECTDAYCLECEPYLYCLEVVKEAEAEDCMLAEPVRCLAECYQCQSCADWMYCVDILEGTTHLTQMPTAQTTLKPTPSPTPSPSSSPSPSPTFSPSPSPTNSPTDSPTFPPSPSPTNSPTPSPTSSPSAGPTSSPSGFPTVSPTVDPTVSPSEMPTESPTDSPTSGPTESPTNSPTSGPSQLPTVIPTNMPLTSRPTELPTGSPSQVPSDSPTPRPTENPTKNPTAIPTQTPSTAPTTDAPTFAPTSMPTSSPSFSPSASPSSRPTDGPTLSPTQMPTTSSPSHLPSAAPSVSPTYTRCEDDPEGIVGMRNGQTCASKMEQLGGLSACEFFDHDYDGFARFMWELCPDYCHACDRTVSPTMTPTRSPSVATAEPTREPTDSPTTSPVSSEPTMSPTPTPSRNPIVSTAEPTFMPTDFPTVSAEDPCSCDGVGASRYGGWGAHCVEYNDPATEIMYVCTMIDGARCQSGEPYFDGIDFWGIWRSMEACQAHDLNTEEPTFMPTSVPSSPPTLQPEYALGSSRVNIWLSDLAPVGPRWVRHPPSNGNPREYVMVPNGGSNPNCHTLPCENHITIPVRFTSSTTAYKIKLRAKGPNGNDDSFWVFVDGVNRTTKPFCQYGFNIGRNWGWNRGTSCQSFITVTGNPDEVHEVVITPREDGAMLAGVRFAPMN